MAVILPETVTNKNEITENHVRSSESTDHTTFEEPENYETASEGEDDGDAEVHAVLSKTTDALADEQLEQARFMANQTPRDPNPRNVMQELHTLWKQIDDHMEKFKPAKEESECISATLLECYQKSEMQNKTFKVLLDNAQIIADTVRTMRKNIIQGQSVCVVGEEDGSGKSTSSSESVRMRSENFNSATQAAVGNCERSTPPFEFHPTERELIAYLCNKVSNKAVPELIKDNDLYGKDGPKDLFKDNKEKEELYFFTRLKAKFDSRDRKNRTAGDGSWRMQNERKVYEDPKGKTKVIGHKRTLNFMTKPKSESWIMHEFTFPEENPQIAVCRVKRGRGNTWGLPLATAASVELQPEATGSTSPNRDIDVVS